MNYKPKRNKLKINKTYHNEVQSQSVLSFLSYCIGVGGTLRRSMSKSSFTINSESYHSFLVSGRFLIKIGNRYKKEPIVTETLKIRKVVENELFHG